MGARRSWELLNPHSKGVIASRLVLYALESNPPNNKKRHEIPNAIKARHNHKKIYFVLAQALKYSGLWANSANLRHTLSYYRKFTKFIFFLN